MDDGDYEDNRPYIEMKYTSKLKTLVFKYEMHFSLQNLFYIEEKIELLNADRDMDKDSVLVFMDEVRAKDRMENELLGK